MDAIFRVDGNRVLTHPDAAGPWDPGMQHGSAPASLVVWAAEAIPTPVPMRIARVTIDLMRPVPVAIAGEVPGAVRALTMVGQDGARLFPSPLVGEGGADAVRAG